MKIDIDSLEAHEKLTARLFIQPLNESGFIDIGNVGAYSNAESREYRTRASADSGARYVDDEQVDTIHQMFEFTLDERAEFNERLISLALQVDDADQDAATDASASFENVTPGRSYFLPARPVTNVVVEVASVAKVEGEDYSVDLNTGQITILESGSIVSGDDVDVEFDNPARGFQQWTAREQPLFRGLCRLQEFNQLSKEPLRVLTGQANLAITTFPEQSGEFGTYVCRLTFTAKPVITKRHDAADPLPADASGS